MRTELQQLQEDLDTTTIYVTHDQTEAMTMSDRIAILDGGGFQQVGTPMECYHEPANVFVAGFIGEPSMNFFDVSNEGDVLVGEDFRYPVSDEAAAAVRGHDDLVLGIRPENIEIVEDPAADDVLPAVVDVVEPHGNENAVHLASRTRVTRRALPRPLAACAASSGARRSAFASLRTRCTCSTPTPATRSGTGSSRTSTRSSRSARRSAPHSPAAVRPWSVLLSARSWSVLALRRPVQPPGSAAIPGSDSTDAP